MTAVTAESLGWQDSAACRTADLLDFFGPDDEAAGEREERERRAKQVCASCPVQAECLDWALARPSRYGVAGGMTPGERDAHRRRIRTRSRRTAS